MIFAWPVLPEYVKSSVFRISFLHLVFQFNTLPSTLTASSPFRSVIPFHQTSIMRSVLFTVAWMGSLLGPFAFAPSFASPLFVKRSVVGVCPDTPNTDVPVYLPDSESCRIFYECDQGIPIKLSCRTGLYFNVALQTCDYLYRVDCLGKST